MDDLIRFQTQLPVDTETLRSNVRYALSLGLDGVAPVVGDLGHMHIYANGPSLKDAPIHYPCMALNGALRTFSAKGLVPNYWAACDPQRLVADFIPPEMTQLTEFLVASKCHRYVFKVLRDADVTLWHVGDESTDDMGLETVPTGVSITLCAIGLAYAMGYREITVYAWDGCYDAQGNSHAAAQGHSRAHDVIVEVGEREYHTTHSWALEAQNASFYVKQFSGLKLNIEGNGLIAAVLQAGNDHEC